MYIGIHAEYQLFLSHFNETCTNMMEFRKLLKMSNLMNLRPMGAELCHADRQTDRYAEANCRFSQFCERWKQADKPYFCDDR